MAEEKKQEPIQVTKYDATQMKHVLDDEVIRYLREEEKFQENHQHSDVKLSLGYISSFVAGGAFLYEYKRGFNEAKLVTAICVGLYWALQLGLWAYSSYIENGIIFQGSKKDADGKVDKTVKVVTKMERNSPNYEILLEYKEGNKTGRLKYTQGVAAWFTKDGLLSVQAVEKDLRENIEKLKESLHKD
ncbi:Signal peptidase complex subunit 2 [Apophysomyces ossiformis]|uniref:Signal peptidase complex subunit 2 n=1 Tax=Apophysomyces ossiformis TaxID=679940 RepID=A0A8H7BSW4_9FUNG|nr:Signal peptidase complex subunit 2 [Apophysomyces ossiformis]